MSVGFEVVGLKPRMLLRGAVCFRVVALFTVARVGTQAGCLLVGERIKRRWSIHARERYWP